MFLLFLPIVHRYIVILQINLHKSVFDKDFKRQSVYSACNNYFCYKKEPFTLIKSY